MKKFILSITLPIFFTIILGSIFADNALALSLPVAPSVNPIDYLKNTLNNYAPQTQGINTSVPTLNNNISGGIKDLIQQGINKVTGGNTTLSNPTSNTTSFSTSDIPGALKSIATLAINLFLIVIQTVAGILKALLPFLK